MDHQSNLRDGAFGFYIRSRAFVVASITASMAMASDIERFGDLCRSHCRCTLLGNVLGKGVLAK